MSSVNSQAAPLMLSVSGARGIVGKTMTPAVAADFAAAFGSFIKASVQSSSKKKPPIVCLGRDSRPSGEMLANAALSGLASVGCRPIDLGIVTTPTVAVMINEHRASGGMAITASHNPIQWNGLKCLNADGIAPPPSIAHEIIRRFRERDFDYADVAGIPNIERDNRSHRIHVVKVLKQVNVKAIRKAKFKVVLDSVNGAGCIPGRMLLEELGCTVVHMNGEPNGLFAHTPEPVEANLQDLSGRTKSAKAACGFAQDPDADRLAVIDDWGRYIGEEYTLVLAAKRVLDIANAKRQRGERLIAANLSTSRMIDDLGAKYTNVKVLRTAVGEANVVAALKPHGKRALLGGEGNGGVILPQVCWVRDSLTAMALVLDLLAAETPRARLRDVVEHLPRYIMIKHKFDLKDVGGLEFVHAAIERVTQKFVNENVSTIDGVRIDVADGWVHLRPSNTEPIVRLIAEAKTDSRAWELIDEVAVAAGLK
jgi:phosphomannomutase